jgi:TonB family protein
MRPPQFTSFPFVAFLILVSFSLITGTGTSGSLAPASASSQDEKAVWVRYSTKAEEFSVLMPQLPGVISSKTCLDIPCQTKRVEKTYAAYSDGVVYVVTSYQNPKRRQSLEAIINEHLSQMKGIVSQSEVTLNKFNGKRYILKSSEHHHRIVTFYMTDKYVYKVYAVGETANDPSMKKFIESFALDKKKATDIGNGAKQFAASTQPPLQAATNQAGQSVTPGQPPQTPQQPVWSGTGTGDSLGQPGRGGIGEGRNPGQTGMYEGGGSPGPPPDIFKQSQVTRRAVIVLKPSPEYTEEARRKEITGAVVLQAVLTATGRVVNIRTISGLPHGLTENAIRAMRAIYFIPAVKDDKRVSQYIKIEYNFNLY